MRLRIIRIIVCSGLYQGPLILGDYHLAPRVYGSNKDNKEHMRLSHGPELSVKRYVDVYPFSSMPNRYIDFTVMPRRPGKTTLQDPVILETKQQDTEPLSPKPQHPEGPRIQPLGNWDP